MKIFCELREINDIHFNTTPQWYWLTDGYYWIDLPDGKRLFEYSYEGSRFKIDYPIIQLLNDLFDALPDILTIIPDDILNHINNEENREKIAYFIHHLLDGLSEKNLSTDENKLETILYDIDYHLLSQGAVSTAHLNDIFNWAFRRDRNIIIMDYDFRDTWTAGKGSISLTIDYFLHELRRFLNEFFMLMENRIMHIDSMIKSEHCSTWLSNINMNDLWKDHYESYKYFSSKLNRLPTNEVDWNNILTTLKKYNLWEA